MCVRSGADLRTYVCAGRGASLHASRPNLYVVSYFCSCCRVREFAVWLQPGCRPALRILQERLFFWPCLESVYVGATSGTGTRPLWNSITHSLNPSIVYVIHCRRAFARGRLSLDYLRWNDFGRYITQEAID